MVGVAKEDITENQQF